MARAPKKVETEVAGDGPSTFTILAGSWFNRATGELHGEGSLVEFTQRQAESYGMERLRPLARMPSPVEKDKE